MIVRRQYPGRTEQGTDTVTFRLQVAREARQKYDIASSELSVAGDVAFPEFVAARLLAQDINAGRDLQSPPERPLDAGELNAVSLIEEIMHVALASYCAETNPDLLRRMELALTARVGKPAIDELLRAYTDAFPPSDEIYAGRRDAGDYIKESSGGVPHRYRLLEDLLISWIDNQNPAAARLRELFDHAPLRENVTYTEVFRALPSFFAGQPPHARTGKTLLEMLLEPIEAHPASLSEQLNFIHREWGAWLHPFMNRILGSVDLIREEQRLHFDPGVFGPGPTHVPSFDELDGQTERFSDDLDWMPHVVLVAKNVAVWLHQLGAEYGRAVTTLDAVPDEALAALAARGFNALWLIGIWQRSQASERIKRATGNPEAAASAYSLVAYRVDDSLGGEAALDALRAKAAGHGVRLACDMVPNHTGLDSEWVCEHPDWFVQREAPPFPSYRFSGADLSGDARVQVFLEDGYWNRADAAVVFKRVDPRSGDTRYIYHGNDGTHLPWNDTAQLNYLLPEVREAVTRQIVDIARKFPIIRFDAAMTLTRKHVQRLWYPEPGSGGDIASRAECAMSRADFDRAFPDEFWREVVDRVQTEAPDTLLLAEAFWLMEGYFVRTLGMHRVYNSAFMNMLKNEENAKYREAIRTTLEFDPRILKRYVNFMSNPDEETAIAQFGQDDKYFGCCVMMVTLPGTPMFGHGQVEGFFEKYGMEYRRSYHDEPVNARLVERHMREIAPLLRRRRIFSDVARFRMYDLTGEDGSTHEDVFAYSNRDGDECCLVVYLNRYSEAHGRIHLSVPYRTDDKLRQSTLAEALRIRGGPDAFLLFRDHITGNEYLTACSELLERGLFVSLGAFKYHVFHGFHEVTDSEAQPYAALSAELGGKGTPDLDQALRDVHKRLHPQTDQEEDDAMTRRDVTQLAGAAVCGACCCVLSACRQTGTTQTVDYHGWEAIRTGNGTVEAVIVPGIARVMEFGRVGGPNLIWHEQGLYGKPADLENADWQNFGGAKLWAAPQSGWGWPPDPAMDRGPCEVGFSEDGTIHLRGMPSPATGVRLDRCARIAPGGNVLELLYTMENTTSSNVSWGIWNVIQMQPGGRVLLPAPEGTRVWDDETKGKDYLKQWRRDGDVLALSHTGQEGKLLAVGPESWLAYEKDGEVFVLLFAADPGSAYPAGEAPLEVYSSGGYVELEHVAPLVALAPGEQTRTSERWVVFSLEGQALTDRELADRVRALMSELGPFS